jgi:hypothetical protein
MVEVNSLQVALRPCKIAVRRRELQHRNAPFENSRRHYYDAKADKFELRLKGIGHADTYNRVSIQHAMAFF